jgi:hypothetical protein
MYADRFIREKEFFLLNKNYYTNASGRDLGEVIFLARYF